MDRLDPAHTLLVVVDVQEKLAAVMPQASMDRVQANALLLLEAARLLGVTVVASEQYPKGLGPTIAPIADKLRSMGVEPVAKTAFDALGEPRIAAAVAARAPRAAVVTGMETHICVFQTVRELARRGLEVHVPSDAVASRRDENRVVGLGLCERAGAVVTSAEAVVF